MDGLLNFSREILPANRGGQMDAPLVLTTRLNPTEIDKEARTSMLLGSTNDSSTKRRCINPPKDIADTMDFVERRLGSVAAVRGYGFTHDCNRIDEGPELSAYKTLATMIDKMNGTESLSTVASHRCSNVASSVIRSHFLPDLRGISTPMAGRKFGVSNVAIPTDECHLQVIVSKRKRQEDVVCQHTAWHEAKEGCATAVSPSRSLKELFGNTSKSQTRHGYVRCRYLHETKHGMVGRER